MVLNFGLLWRVPLTHPPTYVTTVILFRDAFPTLSLVSSILPTLETSDSCPFQLSLTLSYLRISPFYSVVYILRSSSPFSFCFKTYIPTSEYGAAPHCVRLCYILYLASFASPLCIDADATFPSYRQTVIV